MTRLFYHTDNDLYFDHQAFLAWARKLGLSDPKQLDEVALQWIDRQGLLHIN